MPLERIKEGIKESYDSITAKFSDSLEAFSNLKETGSEKLADLTNDVLGLAPLIEQTGFKMSDVSIDIGIPPGIVMGFKKEKEIAPEEIDKILKENTDKKFLQVIVTTLVKADAAQKKLNLANYKFSGLSMKLGVPPDVSLKFNRNEP